MWLQYKWKQPRPRAPDWVLDWACNAPDDWIGHALREDQQAAGLLPLSSLGGPILTGGRAQQDAAYRFQSAYRHWKRAVDKLWVDECHRRQADALQCLLDESAAHNHNEALRRHKTAAREEALASKAYE